MAMEVMAMLSQASLVQGRSNGMAIAPEQLSLVLVKPGISARWLVRKKRLSMPRCQDNLQTFGLEHAFKSSCKLGVSVMDQVA